MGFHRFPKYFYLKPTSQIILKNEKNLGEWAKLKVSNEKI